MIEAKHTPEVINIVRQLREMEVDGETMQMILEMSGMDGQMLRQLIMTAPIGQVDALVEERYELEDCCNHSWVDMDNEAPYGSVEQCRECGVSRSV